MFTDSVYVCVYIHSTTYIHPIPNQKKKKTRKMNNNSKIVHRELFV